MPEPEPEPRPEPEPEPELQPKTQSDSHGKTDSGEDDDDIIDMLCSPVRKLLSHGHNLQADVEIDGLRSHGELEEQLIRTPQGPRCLFAQDGEVSDDEHRQPEPMASQVHEKDRREERSQQPISLLMSAQHELEAQVRKMREELQQRERENRKLMEERNRAKASALESREQLRLLSAEISAEVIEQHRAASPVSVDVCSVDSRSTGSLARMGFSPATHCPDVHTPLRYVRRRDERMSREQVESFSPDSFTDSQTTDDHAWRRRMGSDVASDVTESDITALTLHDIRARSSNPQALSKLVFSDFEVLAVIGVGPNGKVMRVQKKTDGMVFALKSIRRERLLNEYAALGTLSQTQSLWRVRCPFVVRLHYAFESRSSIHLVVDYVQGGQLMYHLHKRFPNGCAEGQARFHAAEVVLALEHLHAHGVIHGDLKPANVLKHWPHFSSSKNLVDLHCFEEKMTRSAVQVLIDPRGHVVLTDFGCAAEHVDFVDVPDSQWHGGDTDAAVAAARYMAPEMLNGEPGFDKEADWWSLGVLIFEMLCGTPPYIDAQQLHGVRKLQPQDPATRFPPSVSPSACALIKALLQPQPNLRLGAGARGSLAVRSHQFFVSMDWARLLAKQEEPPFIPNVQSASASSWKGFHRQERQTQSVQPDLVPAGSCEALVGANVTTEELREFLEAAQSTCKTKDDRPGAGDDLSPEVPNAQTQRHGSSNQPSVEISPVKKPKRRKPKSTQARPHAAGDADVSFRSDSVGTVISVELRTLALVLLPIVTLALCVLAFAFNALFIWQDYRLVEYKQKPHSCSTTALDSDQHASQQCLDGRCPESSLASSSTSPGVSVPFGSECMGQPCPPGSTCEDSTTDSTLPKGKHICTCDTKWRDCNGVLMCGMDVECTRVVHSVTTDAECHSQPCLNGGTCYDSTHSTNVRIGDYLCACLPERHGKNCEFLVLGMGEKHYVGLSSFRPLSHLQSSVVLSEEELALDNMLTLISSPLRNLHACASVPCQHNATCLPKDESYGCVCADGWEGDNCETRIAVGCPYLSAAQLDRGTSHQHRLDSPCNYNACIVHSDGCECLLYQWHYCTQPELESADPFCGSLLEGMQESDASLILSTCMHEMKVLQSRSEESNSSHAAGPFDLDLTRPPVQEVEIAFLEDGPLGLKLKPDPRHGAATVLDVTENTQAAQHRDLIGMFLRQIGDTPVSGQPYKQLLKTLKRASKTRPLVLRFGTNPH